MSFSAPYALLLIIPLIIIFIKSLRKPSPVILVGSVKSFYNPQSKTIHDKTHNIIVFVSCILMVIALAGPRLGSERFVQKAAGVDIMIALDLSGSMLSYDSYSPHKINKNRLQVAKSEIKNFIYNRPNDRIGLVVFGSYSFVAIPPTLDHTWLSKVVEEQHVNTLGGDTNIASPIAYSINHLRSTDAKRKIILLFTDGENNVNSRLSPVETAKLAKHFKIKVYTIGLGGRDTYVIKPGSKSKELEKITSSIDYKILKDIAKETSGRFYNAKDADALTKVIDKIDSLEKTIRTQHKYLKYKEFASIFIRVALLLLIISFILRNTINMTIP